jgi:sugar phosphate isomerase/epimerase
VLDDISRAGYAGVQLEYDPLPASLKKDPKWAAELVKASGLFPVAVAVTFDPATASFARDVAAPVGTLCLFEGDFERAVEKTRKLAKLYSSMGLDLSIQPHVRSDIQNTRQLDELLRACEPLRPSVCFDTAHLTALGVDLRAFLRRYRERISIVHVKDYETDFVDVGDGRVDMRGILSEFEKSGYSGWYVVEVDHAHHGSEIDSIRRNFERLSFFASAK